ncbi:ABC transporter permease [Clostridium vincentii]|uniref:Ribose ABC transporter permease protein n=1 Tax=Clostridium vincentii TaxID=52704 RepID=A0A2T0BBA6_9CLOT|nr:ABC transporter permease [Clostridium vincentii]PRR81125.1 ribose ABC transporter permease protein [Clostridium vincentii]
MDLVVNILEQASLFGLVAMGVYITYKILDFPDLSVEGSYPLGASIVAILLVNGVNPWVATFVALLGGAGAGFLTAFLHVKLKITNLMSGILVMMGLYSINLTIMGKSNTPLFNTEHIFKLNISPLIIAAIILVAFKVLQDIFMKTKLGFLLFAVGDNEQVVTSLGVNKGNIKILGLMVSNALVALAGALTAQYQGYADVGMGTGVVVKGLACVIIGTSLIGRISFIKSTSQVIIGTIIYYGAISLALKLGLSPNLLNLLTAVVIVVALCSESNIFKMKKKAKVKDGVLEDVKG